MPKNISLIIRLSFITIFSVLNALPVTTAASLPLSGELNIDATNISGLVITSEFTALATDEGTAIQILPKQGNHFISNIEGVIRLTKNDDELDLEGLAWQPPYLYAIGSHSAKRKRVNFKETNKNNLQRLQAIITEPSRHKLFQIELDKNNQPKQIKSIGLDEWITADPILEPFVQIPSKENGIDIEGIASSDEHLYIGFRGPVLRGNLATVLRFKIDHQKFKIKKPKLRLVNLGGLGIRDLVFSQNNLKVLAGPVNEIPRSFTIYDWDGKTQLEPLSATYQFNSNKLTGKPEAIAINPKKKNTLWMAQDGPKNGDIQSIKLDK